MLNQHEVSMEKWSHRFTIVERGQLHNNSWLVVSTPLKNISQMGVFFPIQIHGKI